MRWESSSRTTPSFDEALGNLRNDLLTMAGLTERTLSNAINGLLQRNDSLCTKAIAGDEEVDQLEKQIDKIGLESLLRYQPVASDLTAGGFRDVPRICFGVTAVSRDSIAQDMRSTA